MRNHQKTNESGFTLIEVLVAITILGIVMLAFLPFFPQATERLSVSEQQLQMTHLLSRVAHDVRMQPSALDLASVTSTPKTIDAATTRLPAYDFPVTLTVTFDAALNLHLVNILITTKDGKYPVTSYVYAKEGGV